MFLALGLGLVGFPPYLPKLHQAKQCAVYDNIYPEALCGLACMIPLKLNGHDGGDRKIFLRMAGRQAVITLGDVGREKSTECLRHPHPTPLLSNNLTHSLLTIIPCWEGGWQLCRLTQELSPSPSHTCSELDSVKRPAYNTALWAILEKLFKIKIGPKH